MALQAACVGNHDWDMGLDNFRQLAAQCKFPWLLSNVLDKGTSELAVGVGFWGVGWGVRAGVGSGHIAHCSPCSATACNC